MDWYEENIEPEVRNLVKYLRDNGVNTECSCGHKGYIQCQYSPDGSIKVLHDLLYNYFSGRNETITYTIKIHVQVIGGHLHSTLDIQLPVYGRKDDARKNSN